MTNVYNGNTTAGAQGYATLKLKGRVKALSRDFRYQPNVLRRFAKGMTAERVAGSRFVIQVDKPHARPLARPRSSARSSSASTPAVPPRRRWNKIAPQLR